MMYKVVNGRRVALSPEEETSRQAEQAAHSEARAADQALLYRDLRKQAYVQELGVDPDPINTIGDVLDVLIKKVRSMDATPHVEFDALVETIDRIKRENPKPQ